MPNLIRSLVTNITKIVFGNSIIGKRIQTSESNKYIFYEKSQHLNFLFKKNINYESVIQDKIKNYINEGDLVFDIGSNIGQYALLFSDLVGDNGKVICFEPDYKNYAFLLFNKTINNCHNLNCLNVGLGDSPIIKTFYRDSTTGGRRGSFIKEFVGETYLGETYSVQIEMLSNMVEKFGTPKFVKIDVEGFENSVLEGLKNIPLSTIFLIETRVETNVAVFDFFKNNFDCYCIDGEKDLLIEDPIEIPSFANLMFTPKVLIKN